MKTIFAITALTLTAPFIQANEQSVKGCAHFPESNQLNRENVRAYIKVSFAPYNASLKVYRLEKAKAMEAELDQTRMKAYLAPFLEKLQAIRNETTVCLAPAMHWMFFNGASQSGFDEIIGLENHLDAYINWLANDDEAYTAEGVCHATKDSNQKINCYELMLEWWGRFSNHDVDYRKGQAIRLGQRIRHVIKTIKEPKDRLEAYRQAEDWMFDDATQVFESQDFGYHEIVRLLTSHVAEFKTDDDAISNLTYMNQTNEQQDIEDGKRTSFSAKNFEIYNQFERYNRGKFDFYFSMMAQFEDMNRHTSAGTLEFRTLLSKTAGDAAVKAIKAFPEYVNHIQKLKKMSDVEREKYFKAKLHLRASAADIKKMANDYAKDMDQVLLRNLTDRMRSVWLCYYRSQYEAKHPWRMFKAVELEKDEMFSLQAIGWYERASKIVADPNSHRRKESVDVFKNQTRVFESKRFKSKAERDFAYRRNCVELYIMLHHPKVLAHDESKIRTFGELVAWATDPRKQTIIQHDTLE